MAYPQNTGTILAALYPSASPEQYRVVTVASTGEVQIARWDAALGPMPGQVEVEAGALAMAKQGKQAERQSARLAAQTGGFSYDGHRYASDREESIPLLTAATLAAQSALAQGPEATAAYEAALGAGWRSEDGVARIASAVGILSLHAAFVAHGAACDRHSQDLKAAIEAATSVEELNAIDLSAGWPE